MKTKGLMSLAVMSILLTLAMPVPAHAANMRIYFTGTETGCDPLIPGREWSSGPNYHIHVESQTCYEAATIAQFTGANYPHDGVINLVGGGSVLTITGKFRMETNEGGIWVGSFTWPANTNILTGIGHGQGIYKGLNMHVFVDETTGMFSGYIDTGG